VTTGALTPSTFPKKSPKKSPSRKLPRAILAGLLKEKLRLDVALSEDLPLPDMQDAIETSLQANVRKMTSRKAHKLIKIWAELYEIAQRGEVKELVTVVRSMMQLIMNESIDVLHLNIAADGEPCVVEEDLFGSETMVSGDSAEILQLKTLLQQNAVHFAYLKQLPVNKKTASIVMALVNGLHDDVVFRVGGQESITAAANVWNLLSQSAALPVAIAAKLSAEVREAPSGIAGREFELGSCLGLLKLTCLFGEEPGSCEHGVEKLLISIDGFPEFRTAASYSALSFHKKQLQEKLHCVRDIVHALLVKVTSPPLLSSLLPPSSPPLPSSPPPPPPSPPSLPSSPPTPLSCW
jgi:hypothetical protein